MGFFIYIQIAENCLYETHLNIIPTIAFSVNLDNNKKLPFAMHMGVSIAI